MAEERKAAVTLGGNPLTLIGPELKVGQPAPDFTGLDNALQPVRLGDARGKVVILASVPSLDTSVCDMETRRFNREASELSGIEVWTVSMDLPFAQKRWCGTAGVTSVRTLSDFREREFAPAYGVLIKTGLLAGLHARAVFVVGKDGRLKHVEYVKEMASDPTTLPRWPPPRRPPRGSAVPLNRGRPLSVVPLSV